VRVLVDADALAYTCGFAGQHVVYDWTLTDVEGRAVDEGVTGDKTELQALEIDRPLGTVLSVESIVVAQPLVNVLAMCKNALLKIEEAMDKEGLTFKKLELLLTGKGNFRDQIATIVGYKANRVGVDRPVHYKAIRRYMVERWGAQTVHGIEADDQLAIIAASEEYDPERVCIVSMDKDLETVPGRLYNFKRRTMRILSEREALVNFYRQILTGDVVDNIKGCYKCGKVRAEQVVHEGLEEEAMYRACLAEYQESLKRKGCLYVNLGAEAALLENARLLHMLRAPGVQWLPPSARVTSEQLQLV